MAVPILRELAPALNAQIAVMRHNILHHNKLNDSNSNFLQDDNMNNNKWNLSDRRTAVFAVFIASIFFGCSNLQADIDDELFYMKIKNQSSKSANIEIVETKRQPSSSEVNMYVANKGTVAEVIMVKMCSFSYLAKSRGYRYFAVLQNSIIDKCENNNWCEKSEVQFLKSKQDNTQDQNKGSRAIDVVDANDFALSCGFTPLPEEPLHEAVFVGDYKRVMELLKQHPKNANKRNKWSFTPSHIAASEGRTEIMKLLLENKIEVNAKGPWGATPLHIAAYSKNSDIKMIKAILSDSPRVSEKMVDDKTPLHLAVLKGDIEIVRLLLEAGADVGIKDDKGNTPLNYAAVTEKNDIVKLLLSYGAKK